MNRRRKLVALVAAGALVVALAVVDAWRDPTRPTKQRSTIATTPATTSQDVATPMRVPIDRGPADEWGMTEEERAVANALCEERGTTDVIQVEVVASKVNGAYLQLRCLDPSARLGVVAGDVLWAWNSRRAAHQDHAELVGGPPRALAVGQVQHAVVSKVYWRYHLLLTGAASR